MYSQIRARMSTGLVMVGTIGKISLRLTLLEMHLLPENLVAKVLFGLEVSTKSARGINGGKVNP